MTVGRMRSIFQSFLILIVMGVSAHHAWSQTSTPLPKATERKLPDACAVAVPRFISNVCQGRGEISTPVLNLPGVCQQYGLTQEIETALKTCGDGNVFSQMWKYKFGIENKFEAEFSKYVEATVRNEIVSGNSGVSLTSAFEAFRLSVIACGLEEKCHRSLYGALNAEARTTLARTPFFCDHQPGITDFDDAPYKHMFFGQEDGAIIRPMCRAYYCSYENCDKNASSSDLFILSDVFTRQYDIQFKAMSP